jgi:hypothetical protein
MRYVWRLGGDGRRVTSVAANAGVSPAAGATAARPTFGMAFGLCAARGQGVDHSLAVEVGVAWAAGAGLHGDEA